MRKEYDFSKAKRAVDIPHLANLQGDVRGKRRITIMLDNDVITAFREQAEQEGIGYQTLINQKLREAMGSRPIDEATLRKVLREELRSA